MNVRMEFFFSLALGEFRTRAEYFRSLEAFFSTVYRLVYEPEPVQVRGFFPVGLTNPF